MPFSYANPASGPSAGGIGWFIFDTFTTINPGETISGLTGTLSNGTTVTFDLTAANVSGVPRSFDAVPVPTTSSAAFGTAGYTGISGNAALFATNLSAVGANRLTLSNIVVLDNLGNPVPEYTAVVADAETTGAFESWIWNTNGEAWSLLTKLGPGTSPVLSGLGTATATLAGDNSSAANAAFVLTTQNPTQLQLTTTNTTTAANGREAVSIGFATTRIIVQKDIGQRIDPSDQFVLSITGNPTNQVSTTGSANGIQTIFSQIYATPGNTYLLNEAMALGSASSLSDYALTISAANSTPAGSIPPITPMPISFTPALGDDVIYTFLNAAPEVFTKAVDKTFANVGEILTYTITVQNPNNFVVNNVLVTDTTPVGTSYIGNLTVSAPYTGTDPASGITITTIGPAASVTLSWQVQVNGLPPLSNRILNYASVTVPGGTSGITNIVTTQVDVDALSVQKSVNKNIAYPGDIVTYQFAITNNGNIVAQQVVLTDTLPNGMAYVPGSLTANVLVAGTPPEIVITNPIASGQTVTISFQAKVTGVPMPNPAINQGRVDYNYPPVPGEPNIPVTAVSNPVCTRIFRNNYSQQITDLTESVALEQAALAAIINAEGTKIQKMIAMGEATVQELLCLNQSVNDMMDSISMLEMILKQKLNVIDCQLNFSCE